jgi:photosystem II stability/assembly factor-like uncharacterized protein
VAWGDDKFVAAGDGGQVFYSQTAEQNTWTPTTSGTKDNIYKCCYKPQTTGPNAAPLFVAVGQKGIILNSPDGIDWTTVESGTSQSLTAVTYGAGVFTAGGINNTTLVSSDGVHWEPGSLSINPSNFIVQMSGNTYAEGNFLGACSSGFIATSQDGNHWKAVKIAQENLYSAAYGSGVYLVGGKDGACYTSPGLSDWTPQDTGGENYLMDTIYQEQLGLFLTCGNAASGENEAYIASSEDGTSWYRYPLSDYSTLQGITASDSIAVSVGARSVIYRAAF